MLFKGWLSYKCDLLDVSFNSVHMQHINLERVRLSKTKTKVIKSKDTDNVMNQSNWKQMHMADIINSKALEFTKFLLEIS